MVTTPEKGAAQGGPISPFLSNLVLDELDKELDKRGHRYVRFADDCNIYVKSPRAATRVMKSLTYFIEKKLKLKVNNQKSTVSIPSKRKFLGFSFTERDRPHRIKVAEESLQRFKDKVRQITSRRVSIDIDTRIRKLASYITGWLGYYNICEARSILGNLESWIRRRMRCVIWKQWKTPRSKQAKLRKMGVRKDLAARVAWSSKGPWRICQTKAVQIALNNDYLHNLGLPKLNI